MHDCKREVTDGMLGSEVARLVRVIGELPGIDPRSRPRRWPSCWRPSRSTAATCPTAASTSTPRWPPSASAVPTWSPALDALHPVLAQAGTEAATRFEQTSGPVMAKGVEDSAYYRWSRFVALNEVGGDPARFGSTVEEFHAAQQRRAERYPASMTTLSTHDTKRSEDVRARLAVLAELPSEWARLVRWLLDRHPLADRPLAHLVWQNLVGAWPLSRERAHAYVEKAAREAGTSTTWTEPDEEFEEPAARAGRRRVRRRGDARGDPGVRRPHRAVRLVELAVAEAAAADDARRPGRLPGHRALGLLAGRPGQPPSGRLRRCGASCWPRSTAARCRRSTRPGAAKLLVVSRVLRARRDHPEWFAGYEPVAVTGSAADHVVAFDRGGVVAVATRLPAGLARDGWGDTALQLPNGAWRDLLTGERVVSDVAGVAAERLLARLPVALLVRD